MRHEGLLHLLAVVQLEFFGQRLWQRLGVGRGIAAMQVVAFQPALDDGFGHSLATRTAQCPGLVENAGIELAAGRYRQSTVIAGDGIRHRSVVQFERLATCDFHFLEQTPILVAFPAE